MPEAGLQGKDALYLGSLEESDRHTKEPRFYLPQLDALRFFAFLSVFFFILFQLSMWKITRDGGGQ